MMDLDEAIQHCKEQVQEQAKRGCYSCAEKHQQLAEWLKELKAYRKAWDKVKEELKDKATFDNVDDLVLCMRIIDKHLQEVEK